VSDDDAPITRMDLERALRGAALATESVRDDVIQLAAQVVALQAELDRRVAPGIDEAVQAAIPKQLEQIRIVDDNSTARLRLDDCENKYATPTSGPDCREILPICKGRCCKLHFALSTQDLDEGVIRWDYGRPYMIKQRPSDGRCVHSDPEVGFCTVYEHRPRPCRQYDCRKDQRIWADFDQRILADESPFARKEDVEPRPPPTELDLIERVRARQVALAMESFSLGTNEAARRREEEKK
jgi:hypothetical protein